MMQRNSILIFKIVDVGLCTPLPLKDLIGEVDRVILCCYQGPPFVDDGEQRGMTSTVGLVKKTFYADYCMFHLYIFRLSYGYLQVYSKFIRSFTLWNDSLLMPCVDYGDQRGSTSTVW